MTEIDWWTSICEPIWLFFKTQLIRLSTQHDFLFQSNNFLCFQAWILIVQNKLNMRSLGLACLSSIQLLSQSVDNLARYGAQTFSPVHAPVFFNEGQDQLNWHQTIEINIDCDIAKLERYRQRKVEHKPNLFYTHSSKASLKLYHEG